MKTTGVIGSIFPRWMQPLTVLLIMLLGLSLRLYSVKGGYPLTNPDEYGNITRAREMIKGSVRSFGSSNFYIDLQMAVVGMTALWQDAVYDRDIDSIPLADFCIAGRVVGAIAASLSILLIYLAGRRVTSASAALFAAGLVAVSPLHVKYSQWAIPDPWLVLFTTLVAWFSVRIYEKGSWRDYLLGGVCAGLAAGCFFSGALVFIQITAAHFLGSRAHGRPIAIRNLAYALLAGTVAFLASMPFVFFQLSTFLNYLNRYFYSYRTSPFGIQPVGDYSYTLYLSTIMTNNGLGILAAILALIGIARTILRKNWLLLSFLAFPLVYWMVLGSFKRFVPVYVIVLLGPLALFAGYAMEAILSALPRANHHLWRAVAALVLFVGAAFLPLAQAIEQGMDLNLPHTRWLALEWVKANLPPKSKIAREQYAPPIEDFSSDYDVVQLGVFGVLRSNKKIDATVDYVITSSQDYQRFFDGSEHNLDQAKFYTAFFSGNKLLHEITPQNGVSTGPTIRIFYNAKKVAGSSLNPLR